MNRKILLPALLLLSSSLLLHAQNCGIQPTSTQIIGTAEQHERPRSTAQPLEMSDGSIIVTSTDADVNNINNIHATIMRIAESGEVLWRRSFGNSTSSTHEVLLHNDTLYVLYGDQDIPHTVRLDPATGDWIDDHDYFSLTWRTDNAWDLRTFSNNNILMSGYVNTTASANDFGYEAQLCRLDAAQNIAWQYQYGQNGSTFYDGIWESHIVNDEIYSLGFMRVGAVTGNLDAFLMHTDGNGNVVKNTLIDIGSDDNRFNSSMITSDNHIVFVGYRSVGGGDEDIQAVKMTLDGNVVWARTLGFSQDERAFGVVEKDGDEYVLIGQTNSPGLSSGFNDAFIVHLDANTGALKQAITAGEASSDEMLLSVAPLSNGGFLAIGNTNMHGDDDLLVYRLDACFRGFCDFLDITGLVSNDALIVNTSDITSSTHRYALGSKTPLSNTEISDSLFVYDSTACSDPGKVVDAVREVENAINVYPNPSQNGYFNVTLRQPSAYRIVNILGEVLMYSDQPVSSFQVDLHSEAKGLYYLSVRTNDAKNMYKLVYH